MHLWLNLPEWLLAGALGIAIGLLKPRSWLAIGAACGLTLAAFPSLAMWWLGLDLSQYFGTSAVVTVTLWHAASAPILVVVAWIVRRRRSRPIPPGHCTCGYDLTGNVSGICPECGRSAPAGAVS